MSGARVPAAPELARWRADMLRARQAGSVAVVEQAYRRRWTRAHTTGATVDGLPELTVTAPRAAAAVAMLRLWHGHQRRAGELRPGRVVWEGHDLVVRESPWRPRALRRLFPDGFRLVEVDAGSCPCEGCRSE